MLEYSIVGSLSVQANVQVREQDLGLVANYYKSVEPWFTSQRAPRVYRTFISYWDPSSESLALHCLATGDTNLNKFWGKIRYDDSLWDGRLGFFLSASHILAHCNPVESSPQHEGYISLSWSGFLVRHYASCLFFSPFKWRCQWSSHARVPTTKSAQEALCDSSNHSGTPRTYSIFLMFS
jgi:hypothetical protein